MISEFIRIRHFIRPAILTRLLLTVRSGLPAIRSAVNSPLRKILPRRNISPGSAIPFSPGSIPAKAVLAGFPHRWIWTYAICRSGKPKRNIIWRRFSMAAPFPQRWKASGQTVPIITGRKSRWPTRYWIIKEPPHRIRVCWSFCAQENSLSHNCILSLSFPP